MERKEEDMEILSLSKDELIELTKPLYELCDAGDCWGVTMQNHFCNYLGMSSMLGDAALYIKIGASGVKGITGCYMDDKFNAGDTDFELETEETLKLLEYQPSIYDIFDFFGTHI